MLRVWLFEHLVPHSWWRLLRDALNGDQYCCVSAAQSRFGEESFKTLKHMYLKGVLAGLSYRYVSLEAAPTFSAKF